MEPDAERESKEGIKRMWRRLAEMPRWRRGVAGLILGLALLLVACGPIGGGGAKPTPTVAPSPTSTPVPCTTWRIVSSPDGTEYQGNVLSGVVALSPTLAWAVGSNYGPDSSGSLAVSLIEQWNGASWRLVSTPGSGPLHGVTALSPSDIWAVGEYWDSPPGRGNKTLTMHWNGAQWSIVPSPNPISYTLNPNGGNFLNSVVALAANDVWAVGRYGAFNTAMAPLVEHWNGAAWQVVAMPALPGMTIRALSAVARIPGTNQLWAVGAAQKNVSSPVQMLIERYNGAAWQSVAGPTLPNSASGGSLTGVVALSATDAWAVGEYGGSDGARPLIAHWDGSAWTVVSSPDVRGALASVAAASANDVRAIGWFQTTYGGSMDPLILQWNGSVWQQVTAPQPSGTIHSLSLKNITTDGAGAFWIVGGYFGNDGMPYTLTLRCP